MSFKGIVVKESLLHGEWGNYLKDKVDFSDRTARRFIQAAKDFSNCTTLRNLEPSKVYALLDLPSEERDDFINQSHKVNGQNKTVDEMTTRELQKTIKEKFYSLRGRYNRKLFI